uniref:Uncharacterized protein n=1 Tax=Anopheles quadriannulatus TaxID=34691 RepID=A0A182XSQ1_ANOQN
MLGATAVDCHRHTLGGSGFFEAR